MIVFVSLGLLLALIWGAVSGSFSVPNLLFGFVLAMVTLSLVRSDLTLVGRRVNPIALLRLIGLFLVELIKSGLRVARIVSRREMNLRPSIVAYPLGVQRDFEITLLANLITLTPGTLSVDVSHDRRLLYVHCVDVDDHEAVIADIRGGFEALIKEAFR